MTLWTPYFSAFIVMLIYAIGSFISVKTKYKVPAFLVSILIFTIVGGTLHWIPSDIIANTGLSSTFLTIGVGILMVWLGGSFNFRQFVSEWRTVVIAILGMVGIGVLASTIGSLLFGKSYAIASIAATGGATASVRIILQEAQTLGREDIGQMAMIVVAVQVFLGYPLACFGVRKSMNKFIASNGNLPSVVQKKVGETSGKRRPIPAVPQKYNDNYVQYGKLFLLAALAAWFSQLTGLNSNVSYILFGVVGHLIGFIESDSLPKAGGFGFIMIACFAFLASSFVTMNFSTFLTLLIPAATLFVIGIIGCSIFSILAGKFFKWDPYISMAVGLCCTLGYPYTQLVVDESMAAIQLDHDLTPEFAESMRQYYLPKMVISGIVSVSVVSSLLAGLLIPVIFG